MATNNTSGTYDFNLEIGDVIQEATEMIGGEVTLGDPGKLSATGGGS